MCVQGHVRTVLPPSRPPASGSQRAALHGGGSPATSTPQRGWGGVGGVGGGILKEITYV